MGARNKSTSLWYTGLLMVRTELCGVGIHKTAIILANDSVGELNLGVITKKNLTLYTYLWPIKTINYIYCLFTPD
jgi:hypothetical protein